MKDLRLPEEFRPMLRRPFGEIYRGKGTKPAEEIKKILKGEKIIVVGDVTLKNVLSAGIKPDLAIVDFKTKRKELEKMEGKVLRAKNPPGMITRDLWEKIHEGIGKKNSVIFVEGEEDLAVLPAIIEAEWDSIVLYGQPDEGIVLVRVDAEKKFDAGTIIKMMLDREKWI
jgi:hypothetical protein